MNNVDRIYGTTQSAADFSRAYAKYFAAMVDRTDAQALGRAIETFLKVRDAGGQIFFIGNGGSAATASHLANDVAIGTRSPHKPFRAVSLTDNSAVMTAIANDDGYDMVFVRQLEALMCRGDVLVAISASGNSPNLVRAVEFARSGGATTIAMTGFGGGRLKELCDIVIHVPSPAGEYGPVESMHGLFVHIIGNYLLQAARAESNPEAQVRAMGSGA